uniref:Uncharacterized protein n=1 Tax=Parascaris equorum TaxID=6256 RepID=A0A914RKW8_PAREQ
VTDAAFWWDLDAFREQAVERILRLFLGFHPETFCLILLMYIFFLQLRAFEEQLASLQDANSSLVKQNRILEGRVREIDSRYKYYVESSSHYKRELHKAMALLHDTQAMLAHERENAPSQSLIRQLREQLEDAEAVKLSIVKGKHSLEGELCEIRAQGSKAVVDVG